MQSNRSKAIGAVVAIVAVVIAFVALSGGDNGNATATSDAGKPQTIKVVGGEPDGGIAELTYNKGDEIDIVVDSDTASEVHLHGFDVMQDVESGGTTEFKVPADLEGEFEMELEDTQTQIAQITVNPS